MLAAMRAWPGWGWTAGLALAGLLAIAACAANKPHHPPAAKNDDAITAADLDDIEGPTSILDSLAPDERAAYDKSGMTGAREPAPAEDDEAEEPQKTTRDKIGDAAMSVLVVAVSIGAAVAPYLLF